MEGESVEKQKSSNSGHSCKTCGMLFQKKNALLIHERIHTGVKPYKCDLCERSFTQSSTLTVHKRIHTGDKPFACDECKKSFSVSSSLSQHKKTHTGERPYECDNCDKSFIRKSNLYQHKRAHTNEKPYSCKVCQKSFKSSSNLSKHNRTGAHLKRKDLPNTDLSSAQTSFVDCGKTIKVEDIKEEIKEDKSVDDLFFSQEEKTKNYGDNKCSESMKLEEIKNEIKNEESINFPFEYYSRSDVKQEIKEEVTEPDEGQSDVEDSNLDNDQLVDFSQYVQVNMNMTK